jgi:hypothetical protein
MDLYFKHRIKLEPTLKNMKPILKFFALVIFTVLFSLAPFCPNVHAQTPVAENQTDEKEKQEVEKFVLLFLEVMEETNDLNQVPERYFTADFKTRFAAKNYFFLDEEAIFNQLTEEERLEFNLAMLDFFRLTLIAHVGSDEFDKDSDWIFPDDVEKIIKKYKHLDFLLEKYDSTKPDKLDELRASLLEIRNFIKELRKYIAERYSKWKKRYENLLTDNRNRLIKYERDYYCSDETCGNLPKQTKIIFYRAFVYDLEIIKENGAFKIINIGPVSD